MSKKQQGFTLIELMIALGVLAVLAAIAIPAYRGYIAESRKVEGRNNLAAIKLAQEEYFLENNRYFPDTDGTTVSTTAGTLSAYWSPNETLDADRNFDYAVGTSAGTDYTATATGRGGAYKVPTTTSFSVKQ